jgi:hypothetical protein
MTPIGDDLIDLAGRVGVAGETCFQAMVNAIGGVANKAIQDRLGWDFHLQLQRNDDWRVHHTLDTRPPHASCFVQVKATTRPIRSWSLKLSTWELLAKERRPVFLVVLMFDEEALEWPRQVYVVHLGEVLLARALKALREVPSEAADDLNQQRMSFAWSEADALPAPTGRELVSAIRRHIGPDIGTYEATKAGLLKTLGYEPGRYKISVRVVGNVTDHDILAFALGLRDALAVEIKGSVEERFGIAKPALEGPHVGQAEIRFPELAPELAGFVVVEGRSTDDKVRIPCKFYTTRWLAPVLPANRGGMRVVFDGGEITIMSRGDDTETKLTYSLPHAGEVMPLAQAVRRAKVVKLLAHHQGCRARFEASGNSSTSPPVDLTGAEIGDAARYAELIFCAGRLASAVELDPNIELEPIELLDQARQLLATITRYPMTVTGGPVDSLGDLAERSAILLPTEVVIGRCRVRSIVGIAGHVTVDSESGQFEVSGVPELLHWNVSDVETSVPETPERWHTAIEEARRRGLARLLWPQGALDDARSEEGSDPVSAAEPAVAAGGSPSLAPLGRANHR